MNRISAQANMDAELQQAINLGRRAQTNSNSTHLILEGGRKVLLIDKVGNVFDAGHRYYKLLNVPVPTSYIYEQPLEQDKWVRGFNGKRVLVRTKNEYTGTWRITKKGEAYFKYNRD